VTARADFLLRLGIAVLTTLALAPLVGLLFPGVPFHRIMTRTVQVAFVVALVVKRGPVRAWPAKLRALGFRGPWRARRLLLGAATGAGALVLLLVVSWLTGGREPQGDPPRSPFATQLLSALLTAVLVSLFEELLVRGYLKTVLGGLWSALVFAAVHFIQPIGTTAPAARPYDPLLAVKRLPELFEAWTDPRRATLGFLCLFVFALALNRLRDRTGTLYVGMGVHAGVVLVIALYRRVLEGNPAGSPWVHGGPLLRDGLLPLLGLLLLLLAAYRAPLPRWASA
jgi:membrane protease YdiL (CAAX protease family)